MRSWFLCVLVLTFQSAANARLTIVATTPDIGRLVEIVGAADVSIEVIAKGTQDPHFLEPKPSYMVKLSRADLLISNGLALEDSWLPSLIQGARNPKVNRGSKGYLELGHHADPVEIATGKVSRADGDVHPDGNPHFMLDPMRLGKLALIVSERLGELAPDLKLQFERRARIFQTDLEKKTKTWRERIERSGVKKVIAHHNDITYFLRRFEIEVAAFLEPKAGIPPSAQHLLEVITIAKREKVSLVLVPNFFDTKIAERLASEVPSMRVRTVGIGVGSKPELKTHEDVFEQLVSVIEGK